MPNDMELIQISRCDMENDVCSFFITDIKFKLLISFVGFRNNVKAAKLLKNVCYIDTLNA
jgi:hypothetical protein